MDVDWNQIVDDPNCDQILKDLGRTHLEGNVAYRTTFDPIWLETVEVNEIAQLTTFQNTRW